MPDVTEQDVYRIAKLARLHIDEAAAPTLATDLSTILAYVKTLDSAPGQDNAEEELMTTLREDNVLNSLERDTLLNAAPLQNGEGFIVPRVVG